MSASGAERLPAARTRERGAAFAEYALFLGAVSFIVSLGAVVTSHKVGDLVSAAAAILPGARSGDDLAFRTGEPIEFTHNANGDAMFDTSKIGGADDNRLALNLGIDLSNIVKGGQPSPPAFPPGYNYHGAIQGLKALLTQLRDSVPAQTGKGSYNQLQEILDDALAAPNAASAISILQQFKTQVDSYPNAPPPHGILVTPYAKTQLKNAADQIIHALGGP